MADSFTKLEATLSHMGTVARASATALRLASSKQKSNALNSMADEVLTSEAMICAENTKDVRDGEVKGLSNAMLDRLRLDKDRVEAIASGLRAIADLPEPVGSIDETWTQPNGLKFSKVRVPIGVIGMIYESRPNVTADAGGLCVKSGNACILRGGSESARSNKAIHAALVRGLEAAGLPGETIQLIPTTDRAAVGLLLGGLEGNVDLIIPRGGKNLIARVQSDARVPVLAHLEGLCHTYVHRDADLDMAKALILNAKMRRTGICGSTETLLVDAELSGKFLPSLETELSAMSCELRGCAASRKIVPMTPATDQDFFTEHLAPILNVRVVEGVDAAMAHISTYGSGHTDCIVTDNADVAERFLRDVDSAIVMHNTSTQFADGGEFGFGAEIGIATGRLHARGPVGAQHLTTYKYAVEGSGQVRP